MRLPQNFNCTTKRTYSVVCSLLRDGLSSFNYRARTMDAQLCACKHKKNRSAADVGAKRFYTNRSGVLNSSTRTRVHFRPILTTNAPGRIRITQYTIHYKYGNFCRHTGARRVRITGLFAAGSERSRRDLCSDFVCKCR